jgi:methyl-accepting chemotaxis protein
MANLSIGVKQALRNTLTVFVMLASLCVVMIVIINGQNRERLTEIRDQQMKTIEDALAARVEMTTVMIENLHAEGRSADEVKEEIRKLRFGDGKADYLWIHSYDPNNVRKPVMIMHPVSTALEGQDISDLSDKKKSKRIYYEGKIHNDNSMIEETYLFVKMNEVCNENNGSGIVRYYWPKPDAEADVGYLKSSYVQLFKPWGWVIGTGAYADDVDKLVIAAQDKENAKSKAIIGWFIGVVLLTLIIVVVVNIITGKVLGSQLRKLVDATDAMAAGDFSIEIDEARSGDELGMMTTAFIEMKNSTAHLVKQVSDAASNLASSSEELSAGADETSRAVEEVAKTVAEVARGSEETTQNMTHAQESMEQNARAIEGISRDIEDVAAYATQAASQGEEGRTSADEAVDIINRAANSVQETAKVVTSLGDKTNQIGQFISIITGIADQTNLLALNAAIEAARAGEAGRGFAVVAEEVRKLAEESNQAAGNITGLVKAIEGEMQTALTAMEKSDKEVGEGASSVSKASAMLGEIVEGVLALSDKVQNISAASQQINASTGMVVDVIQTVSSIAEENSAASEEVSSATEQQTANMIEISTNSNDLAQLATQLQELVSKFKV